MINLVPRLVKRGKWKLLKRVFLIICFVFIAGGIGSCFVFRHFDHLAAQFDLHELAVLPELNVIHDVQGRVYSLMHGENRVVVPLKMVPKYFIDALLAREDARFYHHRGIDIQGTLRAFCRNLRCMEIKEGGSTITQQLTRNTYSLHAPTIRRKLLEAMIARRIEKGFTKDQILEFYINRIYFGAGAYGLEEASETYFDKPCAELTRSEAALLAGLIRSPNTCSPYRDLSAAIRERNSVLHRMQFLNMISLKEADAATSAETVVVHKKAAHFLDNYATDAIGRELALHISKEALDRGGLRIFTTLDPQLQGLATEAVQSQLAAIEKQKGYAHPKKGAFRAIASADGQTAYLQGALVAIDNQTGGIRAIVGGRSYAESKFNRAIQARRQVGSTFKPFVYSLAFQKGLKPGTLVDDAPIKDGEVKGLLKSWSPANSDTRSRGLQQATLGLTQSRNTMSVRVGETVGPGAAAQLACSLGLATDLPAYASLYLGAFETTPRALTTAYTIFPNTGVAKNSYLIERVETTDHRVVYQAEHSSVQVLSPEAAWITSTILEEVLKTGTACRAEAMGLTKKAAGKTGTTDNYHDAWFVGYTTSLTCGVWVGFDHPTTIMEHGYGSALALPIWVSFMEKVSSKDYAAGPFKPKVALREVKLCSVSGDLATESCNEAECSYVTSYPVPLLPRSTCSIVHVAPAFAQLGNQNRPMALAAEPVND